MPSLFFSSFSRYLSARAISVFLSLDRSFLSLPFSPSLSLSFFSLSLSLFLFLSFLRYIMMTLAHGVESLDAAISTMCCDALDSIATFGYQNRTRSKPDPDAALLARLMEHNEAVFLKVGDKAEEQTRPTTSSGTESLPFAFSNEDSWRLAVKELKKQAKQKETRRNRCGEGVSA